jgi:hypothetical protein
MWQVQGKNRNAYGVLWEKLKKRGHLEPRRRWVDNIRMGLKEIGLEGLD